MAIWVLSKRKGDAIVLLFFFLFHNSSNSCSYNFAILSELMSTRLLSFLVTSLTVGFMLPVMTCFSSMTQNLLCINADPLSMTNSRISVSFSLSSSSTTWSFTSFCFSSRNVLILGSFNSYNAQ